MALWEYFQTDRERASSSRRQLLKTINSTPQREANRNDSLKVPIHAPATPNALESKSSQFVLLFSIKIAVVIMRDSHCLNANQNLCYWLQNLLTQIFRYLHIQPQI